jgi:L-alanine-DL-glutamate epimerase-like enolase superfamily enzyme
LGTTLGAIQPDLASAGGILNRKRCATLRHAIDKHHLD